MLNPSSSRKRIRGYLAKCASVAECFLPEREQFQKAKRWTNWPDVRKRRRIILHSQRNFKSGEVAEWPKALAWKASNG